MELERYIEPGTSSPDEAEMQAQKDEKAADTVRKLKCTLEIGRNAAISIQEEQNNLNDLNDSLNKHRENSKNEVGNLIVWVIVHAAAWVCALFVTELINSNVLEGLWVFLMIVLMIISAIFAIKALVSMLRNRNRGKETPEKKKKMADGTERINQIREQNKDYLVLEAPYTENPEAYAVGMNYVDRGMAVTIDEVNELLRQIYKR